MYNNCKSTYMLHNIPYIYLKNDYFSNITFDILEGERHTAADNVLLAELSLDLSIEERAEVHVTFDLDATGSYTFNYISKLCSSSTFLKQTETAFYMFIIYKRLVCIISLVK